MIGKKPCTKSVCLKSRFKVLPRYFCYSIKAKWVEFTKTGGDRSINGMFACVLTVLLCFKESKKIIMKRDVYGDNKDRNIEKNKFVIFNIISKIK